MTQENAEGSGTRVWSPDTDRQTVARRIGQANASSREALRKFVEWAVGERGLAMATIRTAIPYACTFVDGVMARSRGQGCADAFGLLDDDSIERYFIRWGSEHGSAVRRHMRAAMRWVLAWTASLGWTQRELADAVPVLRCWRLSGLPRSVTDEQISTLLRSIGERSRCSQRDRAIILLLIVYGVRAGHVSALGLTDINWRARTIRFAPHKRGHAIEQALAASVADALIRYLRDERPASESGSVFVRACPPHVQLGPHAVSGVVRAQLVRAGLPGRGSHVLRHAFATRLVRAGQPPETIAGLLGHRTLDSVAVYAKVDLPRLLETAAEWPEVRS